MAIERLDKVLANLGYGTRKEVKNYINSAIESFTNLNAKDVDLVKVKQILKEKYSLVLIEEPFSLKEI